MSLRELIEAGGVEAQVRAAGEHAMRREREFWLKTLGCELPEDEYEKLILQSYIASLRRKFGIKPDVDTVRAQTRERGGAAQALCHWVVLSGTAAGDEPGAEALPR